MKTLHRPMFKLGGALTPPLRGPMPQGSGAVYNRAPFAKGGTTHVGVGSGHQPVKMGPDGRMREGHFAGAVLKGGLAAANLAKPYLSKLLPMGSKYLGRAFNATRSGGLGGLKRYITSGARSTPGSGTSLVPYVSNPLVPYVAPATRGARALNIGKGILRASALGGGVGMGSALLGPDIQTDEDSSVAMRGLDLLQEGGRGLIQLSPLGFLPNIYDTLTGTGADIGKNLGGEGKAKNAFNKYVLGRDYNAEDAAEAAELEKLRDAMLSNQGSMTSDNVDENLQDGRNAADNVNEYQKMLEEYQAIYNADNKARVATDMLTNFGATLLKDGDEGGFANALLAAKKGADAGADRTDAVKNLVAGVQVQDRRDQAAINKQAAAALEEQKLMNHKIAIEGGDPKLIKATTEVMNDKNIDGIINLTATSEKKMISEFEANVQTMSPGQILIDANRYSKYKYVVLSQDGQIRYTNSLAEAKKHSKTTVKG